jgi:hypothetical protein
MFAYAITTHIDGYVLAISQKAYICFDRYAIQALERVCIAVYAARASALCHMYLEQFASLTDQIPTHRVANVSVTEYCLTRLTW